jgi:hypothetical protein
VLPPARLIQARELAAGFMFGGILFLFAFGTMGMSNPDFAHPVASTHVSTVENPFRSQPGPMAGERLSRPAERETRHREATHADLVRIGNILIEAFSPVVDPEGQNPHRQALADSLRYLQSLESSEEDLSDIPLKRSDVAIFLYRMIGELFEVPVAEDPVYKYSDLPKYHYMNVPVEMLEQFGIKLSREPAVFGSEDVVSVEWLSGLSLDLVRSCESRLKPKSSPATARAF